jgi:hypothetical protein
VNCLDYRRHLLGGEAETPALREHRLGCAGCAASWREHLAFESEVRGALEVPVPAGLGERLAAPPARPQRRRWLAAASASALAAGTGLLWWGQRDDALALACIDFVMRDEAKSLMMGAMPREEAVRALARTVPLERMERLGQVKHIAPCPMGTGTAYHVVLMVPQDKVTLLVMPDTPLSGPVRASVHGMHARVVPAGSGSVGVVGSSATVVASVVGAIRA